MSLAYAGLLGLKTMDQHRTNRWQSRWGDEQNVVEPTSFVNVGPTILPTKCERSPNKLLFREHEPQR